MEMTELSASCLPEGAGFSSEGLTSSEAHVAQVDSAGLCFAAWSTVVDLGKEELERHSALLNDFIRSQGRIILQFWENPKERDHGSDLGLIVSDVQRHSGLPATPVDECAGEETRDALLTAMILGLHSQKTLPYLQGFLSIINAIKNSVSLESRSGTPEGLSGVEVSLVFRHIIVRIIPKVNSFSLRPLNACLVLQQSLQLPGNVFGILGALDVRFKELVDNTSYADQIVAWTATHLESCLTLLMMPNVWQSMIVRMDCLSRGLDLCLGPLVTLVTLVLLHRAWNRTIQKHSSPKESLEHVLISKNSFANESRCRQALFTTFNLVWHPEIYALLKKMGHPTNHTHGIVKRRW
eukprot:Gregarina_sp_Poly_1__9906@NODE_647_length_6971_cov_180_164253_g493_i0_p2_GENE_NODE_647_length_6971_cov_180_164253_g493_i0NODE_647_length_6971_cov_180_164253_g493_i0_p2_ORF_typecomplete_len352_score41_11_NODE_647_length_6971_cov_180_164253_g493_i010922147